MPQERSAGVIVFRRAPEPQYLLLHYTSGHWDLPKGHIEPGEAPQETARRELKEETGISDVQFLEGYRETLRYVFRQQGALVFKSVVFFLAETTQSEVALSHEHVGSDWLPYEAALARLTYKNARELLAKAREHVQRLPPVSDGGRP
jgi:bis(5'-nucleosidyl)-tetraphosphatase